MDPYELTAVISAVAIAIAKSIPDNKELEVWSLAFIQLAAALNTIATQRALVLIQEQNAVVPDEIIIDEELEFNRPNRM